MSDAKYPDVHVNLSRGSDGNIFFLIGKVTGALREAGHADAVEAVVTDVIESSCFDDALQRLMKWVDIT